MCLECEDTHGVSPLSAAFRIAKYSHIQWKNPLHVEGVYSQPLSAKKRFEVMNWDSHAAVLFTEEPPPIKRNCQWLPVNLQLFPVEQQTGGSVRPYAHGNVRNAAISSFLENKRSCWSTRLVPPHIPRAALPDRSLLCVGPVSPSTGPSDWS